MSVMSQQIQAVDKQVMALKLRQTGMEYDEIARQLGYKSPSAAWAAVKSALKKTLQEPADELRRIEDQRLNDAQLSIWAAVKRGNLQAIDRYLRISKARRELWGLDLGQPSVNVNVGAVVNVENINIEEVRDKRWKQVQGHLLER